MALAVEELVSNAEMVVEATALKRAIKQASYATARRNTHLQILRHLLLNAEGNSLSIAATDLSVWTDTKIDANVKSAGTVAVSFRTLADVLKGVNGDVLLSASASGLNPTLRISTNRGTITIACLPAEEFPVPPTFKSTQDALAAGLAEMLARTAPMAATDETRQIITAIRMESSRLVATDTHRLMMLDRKFASPSWQPILIPRDVCLNLSKMLCCDSGAKIAVGANANQIKFTCGNTTVYSRLIEGQYPNYPKVIPVEHTGSIKINPAQLLDALDWIVPVARENSNRALFTIKGDRMIVRAASGVIGEAEAACAVVSTGTWSDFQIALSCRYLADGISLFANCAEVTLEGNDDINQIVIRSDDAPEITYVVMPMQRN